MAQGGGDAGMAGQPQDGDGQVTRRLNKGESFRSSAGMPWFSLAWSGVMTGDDEPFRDLAALVVPQDGRLAATGDRYEPYRLVGADGAPVAAATAFFRDLLAAGRAESTVRSYGMDLLRWFRFLRAVRVPWDQATRAEARDFSRWLQVTGKQARPHWRGGDGAGVAAIPAG